MPIIARPQAREIAAILARRSRPSTAAVGRAILPLTAAPRRAALRAIPGPWIIALSQIGTANGNWAAASTWRNGPRIATTALPLYYFLPQVCRNDVSIASTLTAFSYRFMSKMSELCEDLQQTQRLVQDDRLSVVEENELTQALYAILALATDAA